MYKINFIENTIAEKSIWTSSNDNDILKNIFESAIDASSDKKVAEDSKVVVILELPVGGSVSQFSIGETDDTLEVTILKYSLMLNPKALLFSGIKAGILDYNNDGPHTARGGIRLSECAKALAEYRKSHEQKENKKGEKENNAMTVIFNLPDFVSRDNVKHYSYCFERAGLNDLQYNITYFEFETKDSAKKKEEDYMKASSIIFSSRTHDRSSAAGGADNGSSAPTDSSSSQNPNSSANSHSRSFSSAETKHNSHNTNDKEDVEMQSKKDDEDEEDEHDDEDDVYTEDEVNNILMKEREKIDKVKGKYNERFEKTKLFFENREQRRATEINAKNEIINSQRGVLAKKEKEMQDKLSFFSKKYEDEMNKMKVELEMAKQAHSIAQQKLSVGASSKSPDFLSDTAAGRPKRTRKSRNVEETDKMVTTVSQTSSFDGGNGAHIPVAPPNTPFTIMGPALPNSDDEGL